MKKNSTFSYEVIHDEEITIEVTAKNFGDSMIWVRAELDGETLEPEPDTEDAPVFKFTITKDPPQIHTLMMEFTFVAGTPAKAEYQNSISGQDDQGCPCGFRIRKTSPDKSPDIEFDVVN